MNIVYFSRHMDIKELLSYLTEENLMLLLDSYRSFDPFRAAVSFYEILHSTAPNLGDHYANAAVYGLWLGFSTPGSVLCAVAW